MTLKIKTSVFFLFLVPTMAFAQKKASDANSSATSTVTGTWNLTKQYKDISKNVAATEVTFKSDKSEVRYLPAKAPYGMVYSQKFTLNGQEYFVTGWAQGAASQLMRVFAPGLQKNKPLCEVTTFAEEAELRMQDKKLQISVVEPNATKTTWLACGGK